MPTREQPRGGQRDRLVHSGQHTCPVRKNNIVDTVGGFRGRTGAGLSLGCEDVREQKPCSPTADGSGLDIQPRNRCAQFYSLDPACRKPLPLCLS